MCGVESEDLDDRPGKLDRVGEKLAPMGEHVSEGGVSLEVCNEDGSS